MKNKWIFFKKISSIYIIGSILVLVGIGSIIGTTYLGDENKKIPKVCIHHKCFEVELARSTGEHQKGLMFREFLEEHHGMLFIFSEQKYHTFWMKNTLIPLDILWIDDELSVVDKVTAQPCKADPCPTYVPRSAAKYVLEINAGLAEKYHIVPGTKVTFLYIQ